VASLNSIPSVAYMMRVDLSVLSSNRTRWPTTVPGKHPTSSATRLATVMAATRRGCVTQIIREHLFPFNNPFSWIYAGI
jgi:hypothetical protein